MFIKKKLLWRLDKMAHIKKENSNMVRRRDWYITCFQSNECINGVYKDQNRKSLPLEEFDNVNVRR